MQNSKFDKNKIPFIVNDGIIYSKRDIVRLLSDLEQVAYFEMVDKKIVNRGKGVIMRVCLSSEDPTLFLKGMIYINVNSFGFLRIKNISGRTLFELHSDARVIKLVPLNKPRAELIEDNEFVEKLIELGIASKEDFLGLDDRIFLSDEWFDN